jgi:hypothetical protein
MRRLVMKFGSLPVFFVLSSMVRGFRHDSTSFLPDEHGGFACSNFAAGAAPAISRFARSRRIVARQHSHRLFCTNGANAFTPKARRFYPDRSTIPRQNDRMPSPGGTSVPVRDGTP